MNRAWRIVLLMFLAPAPAHHAGASTITSALPGYYNPRQPFTVALTMTPDSAAQIQAVEETPPTNWLISAISHGGFFDPATGKIQWGPFPDSQIRVLTYQVTPPAGAVGARAFQGSAIFDTTVVAIAGLRATQKFPGALRRIMPSDYVPGAPIVVKLDASPAADLRAWAVEDLIPPGWSVTAISNSGRYDSSNRSVKWGPFFDAAPRTLTCTITPPVSSRIDANFQATVVFDAAVLTESAILPLRRSQFTRTAPSTYAPSTKFTVALNATPASYVQAFAIEETIATGWTPSDITANGAWDPLNRKIKWGPFAGSAIGPQTLSYSLTPAANANDAVSLHAVAVFDELSITNQSIVTRFLEHTENTVTRSFPENYQPAQALTVTLQATPIDTSLVYAIEETIPGGWTISAISNGGVFDATNQKLKWGPFFDTVATPRTFSYIVVPPTNAFGTVPFSGVGVFDDQIVATSGQITAINTPPNLTRILPARFSPGQSFAVTVRALPVPGVITYAVEEQVPNGWSASAISDGGVVDPLNNSIKWGPFLDRNLRSLTYTVMPSKASGTNIFAGQGLFNSEFIQITGPTTIVEGHPGDLLKVVSIKLLATGSALIRFIGAPGLTYHIQVSPDLISWIDASDALANDAGEFQYTDVNVNLRTRFYRSVWR